MRKIRRTLKSDGMQKLESWESRKLELWKLEGCENLKKQGKYRKSLRFQIERSDIFPFMHCSLCSKIQPIELCGQPGISARIYWWKFYTMLLLLSEKLHKCIRIFFYLKKGYRYHQAKIKTLVTVKEKVNDRQDHS